MRNNEQLNSMVEKIRSNIQNSLSNIKEEEQIGFLMQRLVNVEADKNKVIGNLEKLEKENTKIPLLERKLSSVEKMLSKTELSKSKLEQLCRELNKSQKEEKEQSQQRFKIMKKTHEETVDAFKKSLAEIQQSVQSKQEQKSKAADVEKLSDNLDRLAEDYDTRLKELKKLYENRETDFKLICKTKDEEIDLLRAELDVVQKRIKEVWDENVKLKKDLLTSEEKVRNSLEAEINLRKMLDSYSAKYSKLLKSLSNSNESFDKVKKEMEKMNGNLIKVESDGRRWRTKVEEANKELKELNAQNQQINETIGLKDRQLIQLQELCRRLQKTRNSEKSITENESPTNFESEISENVKDSITNQ